MHKPIAQSAERAGKKLLDAAFHVHTVLGPGLLESVYERCLCIELAKRGVEFQSQVTLPIVYEGQQIDDGLRLDILVAGSVIAELKAVADLLPIHHAQLMSYLKLSSLHLGFLINFNVPNLKDGIKRVVV
ncbi:MAG: GxxExxY protein [Planctomycetota bacterium]